MVRLEIEIEQIPDKLKKNNCGSHVSQKRVHMSSSTGYKSQIQFRTVLTLKLYNRGKRLSALHWLSCLIVKTILHETSFCRWETRA